VVVSSDSESVEFVMKLDELDPQHAVYRWRSAGGFVTISINRSRFNDLGAPGKIVVRVTP
jgi:hypothetical protein